MYYPFFVKLPSILSLTLITIPLTYAEVSIEGEHTVNDTSQLSIATAPNTKVTDAKQVKATVTPAALFLECATLQTDAARLTCYDSVANTGEPNKPRDKQPLDLIRTVEKSIKARKPKLVLANDQAIGEYSDSTPLVSSEGRLVEPLDSTLQKLGVNATEIGKYTPLSLAYDLDKNSEAGMWTARPHNPMYLMPVFVNYDPNRTPISPTLGQYQYSQGEYDPLELKAQVSMKTKVAEDLFDTNADLWFGYTQQMYWQVYNEDNSRPFRATDYHPEVFLTQPVTAPLPFNGRLRMLGFGGIHHSNGQSDPLSRSWNRLYLTGGAEWGNLSVTPRLWAHIKNKSSSKPSDNPDITDYYGYGDIKMLYDFGRGETLTAIGRYNIKENHGALQVDYTYPLTKDVHGFLQIFHGYGESIIDYNEETTAIGIGIALNRWGGL